MPKKDYADEQDKIVLRIGECEQVINDLENTPAWKVVIKDMEESRRQLDNNWQTIWNADQLLAARVLKFSYKYIVDLRDEYKEELKGLKKELDKLQNLDKVIVKDYDVR